MGRELSRPQHLDSCHIMLYIPRQIVNTMDWFSSLYKCIDIERSGVNDRRQYTGVAIDMRLENNMDSCPDGGFLCLCPLRDVSTE